MLSAVALLVVVAAGCGGAAQPQRSADRGVPRALAQRWESQASAIAAAAAAGDDCGARRLAKSLREQVVATQQKLPLQLRAPLVTGVTALAGRITCTPPVTKQPPEPPHDKHDDHGHHGHHKPTHDGGDGNGQ